MAPMVRRRRFSLLSRGEAPRHFAPEDQAAVWDLHRQAIEAFDADMGDDFSSDLKAIDAHFIGRGGVFIVGITPGCDG
jgi:hypothetical protein